MNIYPNPASDWIKITIPEGRISDWRLMDLAGKIINAGWEMVGESLLLDIGDLPKGIYLIEMNASRKKYHGKFVAR